jgi:hypothetical protein
VKLGIDHHYPIAIVEQLRIIGHDAVAAVKRGWHREPDEALLTNNVGDFMAIVRGWAVRGQQHSGLVFTSDASLPRTRAMIGTYVKLIDALLRENSKPDAYIDRIHWL